MEGSSYLVLFKCFCRKNIAFSNCFSSFLLFRINFQQYYSQGSKEVPACLHILWLSRLGWREHFCYTPEPRRGPGSHFKMQVCFTVLLTRGLCNTRHKHVPARFRKFLTISCHKNISWDFNIIMIIDFIAEEDFTGYFIHCPHLQEGGLKTKTV